MGSSSISNLLFDGMIYRFISEPDSWRLSTDDFNAFLDFDEPFDEAQKIQKIEAAMQTIDRIKDKDGAFTAFESLLNSNPYGLVILDQDFNYIFHNNNADASIEKIFCGNKPKKLHNKIVAAINKKTESNQHSPLEAITIANILEGQRNLYVIFNKAETKDNRGFISIVIPNLNEKKFKLPNDLSGKYKLTKKEQVLLANLITGLDLQDIAKELNVSVNTIRTHLKSIFRKTETNSQSSLISLFLNHESRLIDSYFKTGISGEADIESTNQSDLFIKLTNGKTLCYREYGPQKGRPLIIFHNLFGSRYNIPYDCDASLRRTNRRIIIPDRPGYGKSDPIENYNEQWNLLFNEFITHLGIKKFDLLGNVYGTSQAVNYVKDFPNMVDNIILTSPVFINIANQRKYLGNTMHACARLASLSRTVGIKIFKLWARSMKYDIKRYKKNMILEYSGSGEKIAIANPKFTDRLTLNFIESQKHNSDGAGQDSAYSILPHKAELSTIDTPFEIWIGDEDQLISVSGSREIFASLPNKTFHIGKGNSEDIFYHRFEEIIQ